MTELAQDAVIELLRRNRLIAVATVEDPGSAERLAKALHEGGVRCLEVTLRTDAAIEAIERCRRIAGMVVGAGTVLEVGQLDAAAAAGAAFAVAPCLRRDVVEAARESSLPFFPGVATPSEVALAREWGVTVVKVFPAELLGGPSWILALGEVFPDVQFVPTGGISGANARAYLELPQVLAVGGSWLAPATRQPNEITRIAHEAVAALP